jgi:hypothetical protein
MMEEADKDAAENLLRQIGQAVTRGDHKLAALIGRQLASLPLYEADDDLANRIMAAFRRAACQAAGVPLEGNYVPCMDMDCFPNEINCRGWIPHMRGGRFA